MQPTRGNQQHSRVEHRERLQPRVGQGAGAVQPIPDQRGTARGRGQRADCD